MGLIIGMQCVQDGSLPGDAVRQARLADLVVDPRWIYKFRLITTRFMPGLPDGPRFSGVVASTRMRSAALELFSSDSVASALFGISTKEALDHAHFKVHTGRDASPSISIRSNARWRVPEDANVDTVGAAWVELQHDIIQALGVTHGVIVTATNEYVLRAEIWLSLESLNGTLMHPRPEEIRSYAAKSQLLGTKYVRRPRWGTYLKPEHVEAVGGRAKIIDVVKPPVVRDIGELLYIQLTERLSEATSDAAKARYRAFAELLAPITMPPENAPG